MLRHGLLLFSVAGLMELAVVSSLSAANNRDKTPATDVEDDRVMATVAPHPQAFRPEQPSSFSDQEGFDIGLGFIDNKKSRDQGDQKARTRDPRFYISVPMSSQDKWGAMKFPTIKLWYMWSIRGAPRNLGNLTLQDRDAAKQGN